jgi:hypothetical protein
MLTRCRTRIIGCLLRAHAGQLRLPAAVASPSSSLNRDLPFPGTTTAFAPLPFLSIREFSIKTHMSEASFHSVADRTIQRCIDMFDW